MSLLKIKNLDTGYGKKQVLFNISFELEENESLLLVGPNGSGKSTLLKAIFGILKPWSEKSRIIYNNENITNFSPSSLIKKGIIYIPQKNELFDDLTVKENLEICGTHYLKKKFLNQKIEEVLFCIPNLKNVLKKEAFRLSGGERKLLSIGMVLVNQPKIVMFDEPFAGISPQNIVFILKQFQNLIFNKVSLILVEHRFKEAFKLTNKVIGLKLGSIIEDKLDTLKKIQEVML